MNRLSTAITIATETHDGARRRSHGHSLAVEPYICHPLRMMEAVREKGESAMIVAVLHDVLEETTNARLSAAGDGMTQLTTSGWTLTLTRDEVIALARLSREKGESYGEYIGQIADGGSSLAVEVKLADLRDNLENPAPPNDSLRQRYEDAQRTLTERQEHG